MQKILLMATSILCLFFLSTAQATTSAQAGGFILKEKAVHYALQASKNPGFDIKGASKILSQNAFDLGKIYAQDNFGDHITSQQCMDEVASLGVDSLTYLNKALAGEYQTVAMINGNLVMLIAAGAGQITYIAIDRGGYCQMEKSIHDSYWAANVIHIGLNSINMAFS